MTELVEELRTLLEAQKSHSDWTHDKAVSSFMEANSERILSALSPPTEDDVERVAEGICVWQGFGWSPHGFGQTPNGEEPEEMREHYRELARAAISAMGR